MQRDIKVAALAKSTAPYIAGVGSANSRFGDFVLQFAN